MVVSCGTPTRLTAPPARAMPTAVRIDSPGPTHSRKEWAPSPSVSSRTRSIAASPRSLTTSVAPNLRAKVDRKSTRLNSSHHRDLHSFRTRRSSDLRMGTEPVRQLADTLDRSVTTLADDISRPELASQG